MLFALCAVVAATNGVQAADPTTQQPDIPPVVEMVAPSCCLKDCPPCKLQLYVHKQPDKKFLFSLQAQEKAYVAVALGQTAQMGNDSVVECVVEKDQVKIYQSANNGPPATDGRGNNRLRPEENKDGIQNMTGSYKDGRISCAFTRLAETKVNGIAYDIEKKEYFIQIAAGNATRDDNSGIKRHTMWATTLRAISLANPNKSFRVVDNIPPQTKNSAFQVTMSLWIVAFVSAAAMWLNGGRVQL